MADRPIIFSAPMVRALLDGRKTQTRRVISAEIPDGHFVEHCHFCASGWGLWERGPWAGGGRCTCREVKGIRFRDGDRLWVRETCRAEELANGHDGVRYAADEAFVPIQDTRLAADTWLALRGYRQKTCKRVSVGLPVPSIHMPRWASRLTLTVTDVRVERLNDISEADAVAEGVAPLEDTGEYTTPAHRDGMMRLGDNAYDLFRALWNDIHGTDAWSANPWVVAVTFTGHHANIDARDIAASPS